MRTSLRSALIGGLIAGWLILAGPVLASAAASTLTVTQASGGPSDRGSLPYELAQAAPGDTIDFNLGGGGGGVTVTLPETLTVSVTDLTIIGSANPAQPPASPLITLSPAGGMTGNGVVVQGASGVTLRDVSVSGFSGDGIELGAGASRTSVVSDTATPATISGNGGTGIAVTSTAGPDNHFGGYAIQTNGGGPFTVASPAFGVSATMDSTGTQATVAVTGASPGEPIALQAGADPGCGGSFDPYPGNTATATTNGAGDATMTVSVAPAARAPDGIRVIVTGQNDGTVPVAGCVVAALPPSAAITAPLPGSIVGLGQVVPTRFACHDGAGGPGIRSCADSQGHSAPSGRLDTASTGPHTYTVTAISADGEAASTSLAYTVASAPTVRIIGLRAGRRLARGARVRVRFVCREGRSGPGLRACRGTTRSGGLIPTRRAGTWRLTVVALSRDGQSARMTIAYRVIDRRPRPPQRRRRAG